MPIYDFKCTKCQHEFEVTCSVKYRDFVESQPCQRLLQLKACGGKLQQIFYPGVQLSFLGSGFYVNDYGKG